MLYVLYGLFFISCIVLIISVLLQPGKTDAGALFTSNVSSAAFGPRGTASILSKMTITAASVFMVAAFLISLPAFQGNVSVLQSVSDTGSDPVPATTPVAVVEGNTASNSEANATVPTEANTANTNAAPEATPAGAASPSANK